jgi:hypothetical protein
MPGRDCSSGVTAAAADCQPRIGFSAHLLAGRDVTCRALASIGAGWLHGTGSFRARPTWRAFAESTLGCFFPEETGVRSFRSARPRVLGSRQE